MTLRAGVDAIRRRIPGIVAVPILAFIALGAWGLSSAAGSSPDDDFHLASIWCGAGEREGLCETGDTTEERTVAGDLVVDAVCYAYAPTSSARCQGADFGANPDDTVSTARGNFAGLYPPVFYFVDSALAGPDIPLSVVLIRFANAGLFVALVTATYLLLPVRRRGALLAGVVLPIIPLGMFIVPSTNPSSWALLSAAIVWVSVLGYFETTGRRRIGLAAIATVATVMGAGARVDSAVYAVIGIVVAILLAFRRDRSFALQAILPVILAIVSALFYFSAAQSGAATDGLTGTPPKSAGEWFGLFAVNLMNVPQLMVGVFGSWGLGWLDTDLPDAVWVGGFAVFVGAITLALATRDRRTGVALIGLLALLFAFPAYILTQSQALVGGYVQPRYIMPLIIIAAGVALLQIRGPIAVPRPALAMAGIILTLANSLALFFNIRRYVTGTDVQNPNLDAGAEWWWSAFPLSPMAVCIIGSLAFAGAIAAIGLPAWRRAGVAIPAQAGAPVG